MPVIRLGNIGGIGAVSSITATVTKVVINNVQVYPGGGSIELEPNKTMTIKVTYTASAPGAGILDSWYIGIVCTMGSQVGWDPTRHTGSGPVTNTAEIGNLTSPTTNQTLNINGYGIVGSYSVAPPM